MIQNNYAPCSSFIRLFLWFHEILSMETQPLTSCYYDLDNNLEIQDLYSELGFLSKVNHSD